MLSILDKTAHLFKSTDPEIEVEYQAETIAKFGLDYKDGEFFLTTLRTDCLAKENCGIPSNKIKKTISSLGLEAGCLPGSGCC